MKRFGRGFRKGWSIPLAALLLLATTPCAFAKEKMPVAVLDFTETGVPEGWGTTAAERLAGYLPGGIFNPTWWQPLSRKELAGRLAAQKKYLGIEKYAGREDIVDTARKIGVRYVFYGAFRDFRYATDLQKTKKTVEVGTGQYETQRVRKYGIAGPKEDRQVEIKKSAEVDTAVIHAEAILQVAIGVLDAETGQPVYERLMEKTGEFVDKDEKEILDSLLTSVCQDFVALLRKRAGTDGQIVG